MSTMQDLERLAEAVTNPDRVIRRPAAAQMFGVAPKTLDAWCRAGILRRVVLAGRKRGVGFRLGDLRQLVKGGAC